MRTEIVTGRGNTHVEKATDMTDLMIEGEIVMMPMIVEEIRFGGAMIGTLTGIQIGAEIEDAERNMARTLHCAVVSCVF